MFDPPRLADGFPVSASSGGARTNLRFRLAMPDGQFAAAADFPAVLLPQVVDETAEIPARLIGCRDLFWWIMVCVVG